jgi:dihydroneopterin aldolase
VSVRAERSVEQCFDGFGGSIGKRRERDQQGSSEGRKGAPHNETDAKGNPAGPGFTPLLGPDRHKAGTNMTAIDHPTPLVLVPETGSPGDFVRLEVSDLVVDVLTGIYSEETHMPQPLKVSVTADIPASRRFNHDTPLSASKNYLDLRRAVEEGLPRDVHFTLVEAVADHIVDTIFGGDSRVTRVEVKIVKLALSQAGESIGMTLVRERR